MLCARGGNQPAAATTHFSIAYSTKMLCLEIMPPETLCFPRDDYTTAPHRRIARIANPEADATDVVLAAAARRASRLWRTAMRTGKWDAIDERAYSLAVLDKAVQL